MYWILILVLMGGDPQAKNAIMNIIPYDTAAECKKDLAAEALALEATDWPGLGYCLAVDPDRSVKVGLGNVGDPT